MSHKKSCRVIVTGATGLIGKALCARLVNESYDVVALSRDPEKGKKILGEQVTVVGWDGRSSKGWLDYAEGAYGIVNLAGENIASGRWTDKKRHSILQSRLDAGRAVVEAVNSTKKIPELVIQASAIGYYGSRQDEVYESSSPGEGFLPQVSQRWERVTQEVESQNVRRVIIRTGIVLGREGGALLPLMKPFRLFIGGPLGGGKQWFSWIHLQDEVRAIQFLMDRKKLKGIFNLTSPRSLTQKEFAHILGKTMRRPSWLPVPSWLLRFLMGEMAEEMLLTSQKVVPRRILDAGFRFQFPEVETALKEIVGDVPI